MDFKNKDKVEVSIYLSQAGIPDDICETFESKQLKTLELLLCFSWFIFFVQTFILHVKQLSVYTYYIVLWLQIRLIVNSRVIARRVQFIIFRSQF